MASRAVNVGLSRMVPAAVVRSGMQHVFMSRLVRAMSQARSIVVISPWITVGSRGDDPLRRFVNTIAGTRVPVYIITRRPALATHQAAVDLLSRCSNVEVVFNESVHAKVYACVAPSPLGFAILGSANMTTASESLYEIGLVVLGVGAGSAVVSDLAGFGIQLLRTRPESQVIKRIDRRSLR
jgi:hypothetical protein